MKNFASNRSVEISQKLYEHLLAAYPRSHRREYGGAMAQLFRDQCRDAWAEGRALGVAALWCRILPDLIKTSFIERCATGNPRKFMSDKVTSLLRPSRAPIFAFSSVFTIVFLSTFAMAVAITFLLPESYASTARIKVQSEAPDGPSSGSAFSDPYFVQTTLEIIKSQTVLSNVISQLNLNVAWGKKYYGGETLKTEETLSILEKRIVLQPVRNTELIAITVYSDDKMEAAQIANAIAESYQEYRANHRRQLVSAGLQALEGQYAESESKVQAAAAHADYLRDQLKITDNDPNALRQPPTLSEQMVQTYDQQMLEGQKTYKQIQAQLDKLKAADPANLRNILPTVTGDSMLSDLLGKLHTCEQQLATLTNDYGPADLHITRVQSMIAELNHEIDTRVAGIMAGLDGEVSAKKAALDAIIATVETAKSRDQEEQKREQPYWDEKRNLARLLDFRRVLASKIEEEKLDLQIPKTSVAEIIDKAMPGDRPVKPNKTLNISMGAIVGIILGAVFGSIAAWVVTRLGKRPGAPAPGAVG
jgi:uncharacterized protein involved in exopolysaccharide biosynthesis